MKSKWLKDFKIAIIEENIGNIFKLCDTLPYELLSANDMEEALALTNEAMQIIDKQKKDTFNDLQKLKKIGAYLK